MRITILCGLLAAGTMFSTCASADAGGRRRFWSPPPTIIYVMPAGGAYYYTPPAATGAPSPMQKAQPKSQMDEGAYYFTPGGGAYPARLAAPLTPAYPSPIDSVEYGQPRGWWWR